MFLFGQYVDMIWQIMGPGGHATKLIKSKSVKMSM